MSTIDKEADDAPDAGRGEEIGAGPGAPRSWRGRPVGW
jgi:hypothetical protein